MPTSYSLNQAISLGKQINSYLCSAKIDAYGEGNAVSADKYCLDYITVKAMIDILEFYNLVGEDSELTQTQLSDAIYKINEYDYALLLDIDDFAVQVGSESDALGSGNSVIVIGSGGTTLPTPHVYSFVVATNNQTVFVLPFNVSSIDTDSLYLTLNSASNPIFGVDYTIAGTQMTWTGEYPLSAGWTFELKYSI